MPEEDENESPETKYVQDGRVTLTGFQSSRISAARPEIEIKRVGTRSSMKPLADKDASPRGLVTQDWCTGYPLRYGYNSPPSCLHPALVLPPKVALEWPL